MINTFKQSDSRMKQCCGIKRKCISTLNCLFIFSQAVMNKLKDAGFFYKSTVAFFMTQSKSTMFMTHTVDELLWGYKDSLLTRLHASKPEIDERFGLMLYVCIPLSLNYFTLLPCN